MLGPLAASTTFGVVLTATGPLGEATTSVGADCRDGVVGLLLAVFAAVGSGCEHLEQLLMAVMEAAHLSALSTKAQMSSWSSSVS